MFNLNIHYVKSRRIVLPSRSPKISPNLQATGVHEDIISGVAGNREDSCHCGVDRVAESHK
jgi:hypothetical protein